MLLGFVLIGAAGWLLYSTVYTQATAVMSSVEQVKEVDAQSIKNIEINTSSMDVNLFPHNDNGKISVRLSGDASQQYKDKYKLNITTKGDTLQVKVTAERRFSFGLEKGDMNLDIRIPNAPYEAIRLLSSSGDIVGSSLEAKHIQAKASSGDIRLKHIKGETLIIHTSSGDIHTSNTAAKKIEMEAQSGDITSDTITADESHLSSSSGDIMLRTLQGKSAVTAQSGDISIKNKDIQHDITAETASGDIRLYSINEPPALTLDFSTSSGAGDINGRNWKYDKRTEKSIRGSINAGGPQLKVQTQSGDFRLELP
ncbi:MAG: DUF4097 family beta strand repeat-containing protein [Ectobacillus sp.]